MLLLSLKSMHHLLVLSFLEIIFPENDIFAPSASFRLRNGVNGSFEVDFSLWVIEVSDFAIIVQVDANFSNIACTTLLAEHDIHFLIQPVAGFAQQFEALYSS